MDSTISISPLLQNLYLFIINLSILAGLVNAWAVWQRRKLPGARSLAACVLVCVVISLAFLGISTSELPSIALWWVKLKFLALSLLPGVFFLFCLEFTGHKSWINSKLVIALLILPMFVLVALWNEPESGLFFRQWELIRLEYIAIERQQLAGAFWIYALYSTMLIGISLALLVRDLRWLGSLRRRQMWAITLSVGCAIACIWLSIAFPSVFRLSLTPVGVLIAVATFTWLLFRQGLFDVVPIAYDTVLRSIRDAVMIFDSRDQLVQINDQAEVLLKQSNREAFGKSLRDLLFGHDFLSEFESGTFELIHNDAVYQVDVSRLRTEERQVVGRLVMLRDTTKRKQMEQAVTASEEKFRTFFEQSSDGIVIISDLGRIMEWNSAFEQISGFKREEVLGQFIWDVQFRLAPPDKLTPELYESVKARTLSAARTGQSPLFNRTLEADFHIPDGSTKHVQQRIFPIQTGTGYRIGSITRDITERKQVQAREFDLALEKERVRLLSRFIQTASHEFRTPLTVISLNAFNMARQGDEEKRRNRAQIIIDQISRITKLLDILLKMSELESQKDLLLAQESVEALLDFACENMIKKYGTTPTVRKAIQPDLPPVIVNSVYILDAFEQILDNAYRFSPADGTIVISARAEGRSEKPAKMVIQGDKADSRPNIVSEAGYICVSVHNTGPVIAESNLPHIFETFWREDQAHTTPGFGLGLPMARKIIEMSGGTIQVESTESTGTTFSIMLPLFVGS